MYPFVCVLAPCAVARQLVCAHPIYRAYPQYNVQTIRHYKQQELELERARNAQYSRRTDAPGFLIFEHGQRKLAEKFGRALKSRTQTAARTESSRRAGLVNRFSKLEKPHPHNPYTRLLDNLRVFRV